MIRDLYSKPMSTPTPIEEEAANVARIKAELRLGIPTPGGEGGPVAWIVHHPAAAAGAAALAGAVVGRRPGLLFRMIKTGALMGIEHLVKKKFAARE
jgi:hypothetical protein